MQITIADGVAILDVLLSKADFFVDGKDLQTLSARLPSRAFFCLNDELRGRTRFWHRLLFN